MRGSLRRLISAAVAAALAGTGLIALVATPAAAATNDQAISGTTSPMWQTNNNVEALAVSKGVVYVGGTFTTVRPPGAAAGTQETTRRYLAAFNASTGALITSFNPNPNASVEDLAVSPDGNTLYVVGRFSSIGGQSRTRVAALSIPSGTVTSFQANANATVIAVAADANRVYLTGDFTTVRGVAKERFAAVAAGTGAVVSGFTATLDKRGNAIAIAPDSSRVLIGGNFQTVNGVTTGGMASVDPLTGELEQWDANLVQPIGTNCGGRVTDIVVQGENAFVTGEGDPPGCYEGIYSARISDGHLNWNSTCLGASLGLTILNDVIYKASHQHDCAFNPGDARGGFVGGTARDTFIWWRLIGVTVDNASFVHWSPNTNAVTGSNPVGPHVIETDGTQLFVGGDFTQVNNQGQQGLARFSPGSNASPANPAAPTVQSTALGTATVTWPSVVDADSGTLTYRLFRGTGTTPIYTTTVESYPWSRPTMRFDDTGRPAGSTQSYTITVSDGTHTSTRSPQGSAVMRSAAPASYRQQVTSNGAASFWRFDETATSLIDAAQGDAATGVLDGGVTRVAGGVGPGHALRFDGSTGAAIGTVPFAAPGSFTASVWFRTTSISGGSILAMSATPDSAPASIDRAITMDNNGNVVFSIKTSRGGNQQFGPRLANARFQGPTYNNGQWHQAVGTLDATTGTITLYMDGVAVYSVTGLTAWDQAQSYLRLGYSDLSQMQAVFGRNYYNQIWPQSGHFAGDIDEAAVFTSAFSPAQVAELYAAGVADTEAVTPPANNPPAAAFTSSATLLDATFDGTGSTDSDGTVATWDWTFGDGATATGSTAAHTYAAAGTYTVTLTVTDDDGASASVSHQVVVTAPVDNASPTAAFTATPTDLELAVDGAGSTDADGTIASWAWTFGDGGTATGTTATHTYAAAGTYTVTLTVVDDDGAVATASQQVTVTAPPPQAVAIVVADPTALNTGDVAVRDRLTGLGFTVTIVDDTGFTAASVADADLVVIGQSVTATAVATTLRSTSQTVWVAKPYLLDDLGMTGATSNVDYGSLATQTVDIAAPASPFAAGRSGTVTFYTARSTVHWGLPGSGASVVATASGRATVFVYGAGSTLADGTTAPGCRLSFPLWATAPTLFTADAWAMFDATATLGADGC